MSSEKEVYIAVLESEKRSCLIGPYEGVDGYENRVGEFTDVDSTIHGYLVGNGKTGAESILSTLEGAFKDKTDDKGWIDSPVTTVKGLLEGSSIIGDNPVNPLKSLTIKKNSSGTQKEFILTPSKVKWYRAVPCTGDNKGTTIFVGQKILATCRGGEAVADVIAAIYEKSGDIRPRHLLTQRSQVQFEKGLKDGTLPKPTDIEGYTKSFSEKIGVEPVQALQKKNVAPELEGFTGESGIDFPTGIYNPLNKTGGFKYLYKRKNDTWSFKMCFEGYQKGISGNYRTEVSAFIARQRMLKFLDRKEALSSRQIVEVIDKFYAA